LSKICYEKVSSSIPKLSLGILRVTFEFINSRLGVVRVADSHNWNNKHIYHDKDERRNAKFTISHPVFMIAQSMDGIVVRVVPCHALNIVHGFTAFQLYPNYTQ